MNTVIPIMKIAAIVKIKMKVLSTPSARFDAPVNIMLVLTLLP